MKRPLSARQQRMLVFLQEFTREHGYPPTIREIGQAVGISSTSVVGYNLGVLERQGYLRREAEISRGIELLFGDDMGARRSLVSVPVVGRIAAGEPIDALPDPSERIELGSDLTREGAYALRVRGKSMIDDLIDDGDLIIVWPQETANNGDIVVALLTDGSGTEGRATLKRLYREENAIRLQPANREMEPIYVQPNQLRIQGKVIAILRKYYPWQRRGVR